MTETEQAKELLKTITGFVDWDCGWGSREGCEGQCVFGKKIYPGGFSVCRILQDVQRVLKTSEKGDNHE